MVIVFVYVFGIVSGFALALFAREWLRGCEARQKAKLERNKRRK